MTRDEGKGLRNGLIITAFGVLLTVFVGFLFSVNDRLMNLEKSQAVIQGDVSAMREFLKSGQDRASNSLLR